MTNYSVIDTVKGSNALVELIQYDKLSGSDNLETAQTLFFAQESGMKLKQVRITLNRGAIVTEAGALQFLKGDIRAENNAGGASGVLKKFVSSALTKEAMFKPKYEGTGVIYLEPSFGHYLIFNMENDEMVVDKGMFYCCEPTVEVSVEMQKNLSSAIAGGEGLFQTKLKGSGIVVLTSPVPQNEIVVLELDNEKVQVDGNFALLRTGNVTFSVEKSTKSIFGSLTSGEGLIQTFKGTGQVWVAPTQPIYQHLNLPLTRSPQPNQR